MDILWVENHQRFSRMALRRYLTEHDVVIVPSLAAARQLLSAERYHVVLLDYDLDDGKGDELVAELKLLTKAPIVIATSSHADGNRKLIDAGADAVCNKMSFANINEVVRQFYAEQNS